MKDMKTKKAKKAPTQGTFDKKMKSMGYEWVGTGGNCGGLGKHFTVMGDNLTVLISSDGGLPRVDDCETLGGFVYSADKDLYWNLIFSDAEVAMRFAEKAESLMKKTLKGKAESEIALIDGMTWYPD